MGLKITIKFDQNGITETQMSVTGGSGDVCLLNTKAVRDLNPNGAIVHLPEFYEDEKVEEEKVRLTG